MLKRQTIPKAVKNIVWENYHGPDNARGLCVICEQRIIKIIDFHACHIIPQSKGGSDAYTNLVPGCSECNLSMSTRNLLEYKDKYFPNKNNFRARIVELSSETQCQTQKSHAKESKGCEELERSKGSNIEDLTQRFSEVVMVNDEYANKINLNTANIQHLMKIRGIGKTRAEKIIKARPFKTIYDVQNINGIGSKLIEVIKEYCFVD
jgi:competence ComEA-like helix-hairpin-helix protein